MDAITFLFLLKISTSEIGRTHESDETDP